MRRGITKQLGVILSCTIGKQYVCKLVYDDLYIDYANKCWSKQLNSTVTFSK